MTEILAVFKSRSQAMDCYTRLRAYNIPAGIINTPKEANAGCGLSVKFAHNVAPRVKRLIENMDYSSFYGYMKIDVGQGNIKRY